MDETDAGRPFLSLMGLIPCGFFLITVAETVCRDHTKRVGEFADDGGSQREGEPDLRLPTARRIHGDWTFTGGQNSDVFPSRSVAVATIQSPVLIALPNANETRLRPPSIRSADV